MANLEFSLCILQFQVRALICCHIRMRVAGGRPGREQADYMENHRSQVLIRLSALYTGGQQLTSAHCLGFLGWKTRQPRASDGVFDAYEISGARKSSWRSRKAIDSEMSQQGKRAQLGELKVSRTGVTGGNTDRCVFPSPCKINKTKPFYSALRIASQRPFLLPFQAILLEGAVTFIHLSS